MLVTVLTIAQLVYVVVLATWILFEKRPPVATLAWILSLIALPYVGLLVFFFFGPRRIIRRRLKHKRARGAVVVPRPSGFSSPPPAAHDGRVAELAALIKHAGEPPPTSASAVEIFHDAASTYDAIEAAILKATRHVHVSYYIFEPHVVGTRFRDVLIRRAKAGVVVRVLVDDVGSSAMGRAFIESMKEAGIIFARFNPVFFARFRGRFDFRNHRKIVVCDGTIGFTGGVNLSDDYLPARGGESARTPWRDSHVRIEGDAVRWLQLTFLDDWYHATGYAARDKEYFPTPEHAGDHLVQVVASGPDRDVESIKNMYFAAITIARSRVYVTTPYFVPDDAILTALTTTAMRGVDVRVLVPRRTDSLVVTAAARSYYDALIASGVRVYEYQPTMIHAKTLVVDDFFAAVGTANMDNRSFRLNFEVVAIAYGATFASNLAAQFHLDLSDSLRISTEERRHLPFRWRAAEAGARILSPLL
jgi:cardiolipin synthase